MSAKLIFIEDNKENKIKLGQFYTTNFDYILSNMFIPTHIEKVIEPFCGKGDLLAFLKNREQYILECYDIEPQMDFVKYRDTLNNPPEYKDKFILTNPPYLARNKNSDKTLYDKYKCNDLYKCFILSFLVQNDVLGGIIIVPLNFICSIRKEDVNLRKKFLSKFHINRLNIFEEKVFNDTGYSVCSLQFSPKKEQTYKSIDTYIFSKNTTPKKIELNLNDKNNYTIGGEIYKYQSNKFKVERWCKKSPLENLTNIYLKCIDDSDKKSLGLSLVKDSERYIDDTPNLSARSYATLIISPQLDMERQKLLVEKFNKFLNETREKYNSLFLTNYREGRRKRISFELAFNICAYLCEKLFET